MSSLCWCYGSRRQSWQPCSLELRQQLDRLVSVISITLSSSLQQLGRHSLVRVHLPVHLRCDPQTSSSSTSPLLLLPLASHGCFSYHFCIVLFLPRCCCYLSRATGISRTISAMFSFFAVVVATSCELRVFLVSFLQCSLSSPLLLLPLASCGCFSYHFCNFLFLRRCCCYLLRATGVSRTISAMFSFFAVVVATSRELRVFLVSFLQCSLSSRLLFVREPRNPSCDVVFSARSRLPASLVVSSRTWLTWR